MFTALLASYNEVRINEILNSIENSLMIDKIVIIDDGSDNPLEFIKKHQFKKEVIVSYHPNNAGKSFAIKKGCQFLEKNDVVFLIDCDLKKIDCFNLDKALAFYLKNNYEMVILARDDSRFFRTNELLSGERILKASYLKKVVKNCSNYNLETLLNNFFLINKLGIKVIQGSQKNSGKIKKWGIKGLIKNITMWKDLYEYGYFKQIDKI